MEGATDEGGGSGCSRAMTRIAVNGECEEGIFAEMRVVRARLNTMEVLEYGHGGSRCAEIFGVCGVC